MEGKPIEKIINLLILAAKFLIVISFIVFGIDYYNFFKPFEDNVTLDSAKVCVIFFGGIT